ncbi:DUF4303 domain-containing protein [Tessaracoccus sp. SD287]|uniref:DUF4303 domain-containing protein n=1 Tax=Tessaracoccus sp. SD287 TaxID=2782008 RepID=UPI001A96BF75|nr:DUF4303 domain-containing protein [Tessaracoccus sp. SD287]MBO1029731.1 DUF4303 domain-containing protein [Tessaracoccus sp. SD287]
MSQSADLVHAELRDLYERMVACFVATIPPMLASHADEDLYALAVTTDSDVTTCRLLAHTEEALAAIPEVDDEPEYYRWWPDEWSIHDWEVDPESGAETTTDLSRDLFDLERTATASGIMVNDWHKAARDILQAALGHELVAQSVTNINPDWAPVLFVADTDGDQQPTLDSIDQLNAEHPDPELVAAARTFFAENS